MALPAVIALALAWPAAPAPAQQPLSALQTDVDALVREAGGSVVTVFARRSIPLKKAGGATQWRTKTRVGSAVAIEEDVLLTTASVVVGAEHVLVRTSNGLQADAEVLGSDPVFNVALLRLRGLRMPALKPAEARPVAVGDWIIALGSSYNARPTHSVGFVAYRHEEPSTVLLQTTNTVYPGNSGGAALNAQGRLVGIIQGELGPPDPSMAGEAGTRPSGASFVLPLEVIRPVYEKLRQGGRVTHGYLGVSTSAASVESTSEPGARVPIGALVESVVPGGPGARAGLRKGDLLVGFQTERVEYPSQLARWVASGRPGTTVRLVWVRDEQQKIAEVALGESPYQAPRWSQAPAAVAATRESAPRDRISDLERQIQELNRQLQALRAQSGADSQAPPR